MGTVGVGGYREHGWVPWEWVGTVRAEGTVRVGWVLYMYYSTYKSYIITNFHILHFCFSSPPYLKCKYHFHELASLTRKENNSAIWRRPIIYFFLIKPNYWTAATSH